MSSVTAARKKFVAYRRLRKKAKELAALHRLIISMERIGEVRCQSERLFKEHSAKIAAFDLRSKLPLRWSLFAFQNASKLNDLSAEIASINEQLKGNNLELWDLTADLARSRRKVLSAICANRLAADLILSGEPDKEADLILPDVISFTNDSEIEELIRRLRSEKQAGVLFYQIAESLSLSSRLRHLCVLQSGLNDELQFKNAELISTQLELWKLSEQKASVETELCEQKQAEEISTDNAVVKNLPATLNLLVSGRFAGFVHAATNKPSSERVTAVIREMLASDPDPPSRYGWSAEMWRTELKVAKRTVTKSEGWHEILAWRQANKDARVPK